MASYLANNASRDSVTLILSKAEAQALHELADASKVRDRMNGKTGSAADRAMDALFASTNTSARRAGFFD